MGDAGDLLESLIKDGIVPEVLTDQTSAHDPVHGYVPNGLSLDEAAELRKSNPDRYKVPPLKLPLINPYL